MSTKLSFDYDAPLKAIDRIRALSDDERTEFVKSVFLDFFAEGIAKDPKAFNGRFRKMSSTPFNFYRGSALLFYQDLKVDQDQWIQNQPAAGNVFIHGDLHGENFGSYLNSDGVMTFDVNDFDEGYCGPFTWDVKRLMASLNLICHSKGFSDDEIEGILRQCVQSYVKQVEEFCKQEKDRFALTLENTSGKVLKHLNETRIKSHLHLLDAVSKIENYDRRFIRSNQVKDVDEPTKAHILQAFEAYYKTIPDKKKFVRKGVNKKLPYRIKDIVARTSPGVGSAGKVSYSILVEGPTEALENDVVLYMKPAQKSAVSYVISNPELEKYFSHDGLRIVLCSYAMQASTHRWLGYTTLNNVPCLVDQVTAHADDLSWSDISDFNQILEVVQYLGKATAKIHCVADSDCVNLPKDVTRLPLSVIPQHTEKTIRDAIRGQDEEFVNEMVEFGMAYGSIVRRDHLLFFDLFRNKLIPGLD